MNQTRITKEVLENHFNQNLAQINKQFKIFFSFVKSGYVVVPRFIKLSPSNKKFIIDKEVAKDLIVLLEFFDSINLHMSCTATYKNIVDVCVEQYLYWNKDFSMFKFTEKEIEIIQRLSKKLGIITFSQKEYSEVQGMMKRASLINYEGKISLQDKMAQWGDLQIFGENNKKLY